MTTPHNIFFDTTGIEITPAINRALQQIIKNTELKTLKNLCAIAGSKDVKDRLFHVIVLEYQNKYGVELKHA